MRDGLAHSHVRVFEVGGAARPGDQGHAKRRAFQRGQGGGGGAVRSLVAAAGKHQHLLRQGSAAGEREVGPIIGRRAVRGGVIDDAYRCIGPGHGRRRRQRREDHGTGAGAVIAGADDQAERQIQALRRDAAAPGQGDFAGNVDIVGGAHGDVAVGRRHGPGRGKAQIAPGPQQDTAVDRRDGGIDVDVAPAAGHQVAVGGRDGLVDIDIALGVQGQRGRAGTGAPADRLVDVDVAVARHRRAQVGGGWRAGHHRVGTRRGGDGDTVGHQQGRQGGAGHVVSGAAANGEVLRVDQPVAGLALGGIGKHSGIAANHHFGGRGFNEAAVAAVWRAGVERSADVERARLHVAHQLDDPAMAFQPLGADHAGVVDGRLQQMAGRLGGQQHTAAVGLDQAAVFNQRLDGAVVDTHAE